MSRQKHSSIVITMSGLVLLHFAFVTKPHSADLATVSMKLSEKMTVLSEPPTSPRAILIQIEWPESQSGRVELTIHDLMGRPVRRLFRGEPPQDKSSISWDGNDDAGQPVPAGKYWYRITTSTRMYSRMLNVTR